MQVDGPLRGRGRLKRTWIEVVKVDLKKCNLSEGLAQDRSEWRNKIHVAAQHSWDKALMMMIMIYAPNIGLAHIH